MKNFTRVLFLAVISLMAAQPATAQDGLKFADLGDFRLENGQTIRECRIGYRTFGELNRDKSNAVLFPTYFSGTTKDLLSSVGPGKLADSSNYFVILVDALGNGVSSSPSNSKSQPGIAFPQFSIRDMVNAQHRLVTEKFQLKRLYAVMGISMGGMQTFQWLVSYPDFLDKAISIVGTPRQTSYDLLLWQTELRAIESGRKCENGDKQAMRIIAGISALALQTPQYLVAHTSSEQFQSFIADEERRIMAHDANDWASQLKAMIEHDIYKSFGGSAAQAAAAIKARVMVIVSEQDHMVNPTPSMEFAKLLKAETIVLSTDCGHLGFGCESGKAIPAVARFLSK